MHQVGDTEKFRQIQYKSLSSSVECHELVCVQKMETDEEIKDFFNFCEFIRDADQL